MNRGPKPKTPRNSRQKLTGSIAVAMAVPVSNLTGNAKKEFQRLVIVLDNRGTFDRVDVAVITECARVTARLDQAYADDDMKVVNQLTTQRRGLLRELGLTLQPSRTLVKTTAKSTSEPGSKWGDKLKVVGN